MSSVPYTVEPMPWVLCFSTKARVMSQSSRPGGLGVGLYQCKQIVEAHRGTIQIRSAPGKGAQVRIEFPLPRPSDSLEKDVIAHSIMPS